MYYEDMDNLDERSELNGNLVDTRAFIFNTTTGKYSFFFLLLLSIQLLIR